jgi:hypothetical protein
MTAITGQREERENRELVAACAREGLDHQHPLGPRAI